jgi:DNA-binding transcriptional regulator LsrR (DeoR family)
MDKYHKQLISWAKRRERLLSMIHKGKTQADIGRELGITRQAVSKLLAKAKK